MREIKFRAWDGKEMITWGRLVREWGDLALVFEWGETDHWKVMQYTGLHDKNGKEIYEGDIVESIGEINGREYSSRKLIKWMEGQACFGAVPAGCYDYSEINAEKMGRIAVIGNIYENPELLETK